MSNILKSSKSLSASVTTDLIVVPSAAAYGSFELFVTNLNSSSGNVTVYVSQNTNPSPSDIVVLEENINILQTKIIKIPYVRPNEHILIKSNINNVYVRTNGLMFSSTNSFLISLINSTLSSSHVNILNITNNIKFGNAEIRAINKTSSSCNLTFYVGSQNVTVNDNITFYYDLDPNSYIVLPEILVSSGENILVTSNVDNVILRTNALIEYI